MPPQANPSVSLLPEGAFVVQFREGVDLAHGPMTGRVEHVVSGQAARFTSLEELIAFFTRILSTIPRSASAPPSSRSGAR
jgi:hypothetical protein